jgi:indolepyruvate ferredoxin oxidoreductase alpha subunit
MDAVYNKGYSTTIILDNRITAMTGLQEHPGTGYTAKGEPTTMVDYEQIVRSLGVKHVRKVNPYDLLRTMEAIREESNRDDASVLITENAPCLLHRREKSAFKYPYYTVEEEFCRGCKQCLEIGCPAISWCEEEGITRDAKKRKGRVVINRLQCPGCGLCAQVCKFDAISGGQ